MLTEWTDPQILAQLDSGYRWSGSAITYAFAGSSETILAQSGEAGGFARMDTTQQIAAQLALSLWDDLILPDARALNGADSYLAADIEFAMSNTGVGYAHAYYPGSGSVWFNPDYADGTNSLTDPAIGRHGFATYIHEIGHALGLDHMGDYDGTGVWDPQSYQDSTVYSVMSYFGPSWGSGASAGKGDVAWADWEGADGVRYSPQTPMLNDVLAIQAIYGAATTTRSDNTVYGFNSTIKDWTGAIYDFARNAHPILTLFDSSGIDTLDLSGWSSDSVINLAPGAFSSANAMTSNIAIARTADIENAIGGTGNDVITGNALANLLVGGAGDDVIVAMEGDDQLIGGTGNDVIVAMDGRDTIYAGAGDDLLDGGAGNDNLVGGAGNDIFVIDSRGDIVSEFIGQGYDTVLTVLESYTLPRYVEALRYTGTRDFAGLGNTLANTITGGAGDDRLDGAGGNDALWGLAGRDAFIFSGALAAGNIDTIADFDVQDDVIVLLAAAFPALTAGALAAGAIALDAATENDDRIVYAADSGALLYDADGDGGTAAVQFAMLAPQLVLTADNFLVV